MAAAEQKKEDIGTPHTADTMDEQIGTFCAFTSGTPEQATRFLQLTDGNVEQAVELYFSNPDLLWASEYHLPRLGQGGFREALEGVWEAVTGGTEKGVKLEVSA